MQRHLLIPLAAALFATIATADVLVVRKGKRIEIIGLKSKIDRTEVTIDNFRAFLDQSTGIIARDGYDSVWFKKSERGKAIKYPLSNIVGTFYTSEPESLLEGSDLMSTRAYAQAIRAFREVASDANARPVYRIEAQYYIGISYALAGARGQAAKHFAGWKIGNSKYTPQVYRLMAELHLAKKKFKQARAWYGKIAALEGITKSWAYQSRLGEVNVDIRERKFDAAESKAGAVVRQIGADKTLADPLALAYALQGRAILASEKKERYPAAQKLLEQATSLEGVSDTNNAIAHSALGDLLYAQGKPEEARFCYMRVVCLYPGESDYTARGLLNAGQCFLDMSGRSQTDPSRSDRYLVSGMKLLFDCASKYKGSSSARPAGSIYRARKAEMEAAQKRLEAAVQPSGTDK